MRLEGAVTIVTGGARGLGRAIAEAFVAEGAKVALADVLADEVERTAGELGRRERVVGMPVDVTVVAEVETMMRRVTERLGPIDVLVNCAGTLSAIGPVLEVDPDRWRRDLLVSLYGSFLCSRAVLPEMCARRGGYILNMFGGGREPQPYQTGYVSAKAGLLLLTEALAREVAGVGIKVFAMRPGPVWTEMTAALVRSPEGQRWLPDFGRIFEEGRAASPDLVAGLAVNLVSGRADALSGRLFDAEEDFEAILGRATTILDQDLLTLRVRR